jgi:hypothetical protein
MCSYGVVKQSDQARHRFWIEPGAQPSQRLRLHHDLAGAERLLEEALTIGGAPGLEVDNAKAKVVFAVLRNQQGRQGDAYRLLLEADKTFERKLDELEHGESPRLREDLQSQRREVLTLRETLSR